MAKSNASSHKLYIVESSVNKLVGELTSIGFSFKGEMIDLTSKDNGGFRDFIMGLKSFSLSIEGFIDFQPDAAVRNYDDLYTLAAGGTSAIYLLKNATSGDTTHQGTGYLTGLDITSATEAGLKFTATIEYKGNITTGVVAP